MVARILAVEDNPTQAKILDLLLRDHYTTVVVASAEACLLRLQQEAFDLILLDVNLPGMNGYEACRRIKADSGIRHLPVIFISVNCSNEDRLQGFDAGGFDYLNKPIVKEELLRKIAILLEYQEEKLRMQSHADYAVSTAMTAMTSAAEQGLVLQFMKASFACQHQKDLADAILHAVRQFGLDGIVQIRSDYGIWSRNAEGGCTPLEVSVLANVCHAGRVVDLKQRTAINYPRVTLILRNMPTEDAERYGRLKDHLNMLLEGADARVMALDMDSYLAAEARRLLDAIKSISETLVGVSRKTQELHASYGTVFDAMARELETCIPLLELNRHQEAMLDDLLREASEAYVALAGQESAVDKELMGAMESLQKIAPQRHPTLGDPAGLRP
ncbi:MAG: response regulator [Rhodocyclaceae bacterium]|nr:response regulator [Rhodocyclaceae bacterium]